MTTKKMKERRHHDSPNGLSALKDHLQCTVGVTPRTLTDVEVLDLLEEFLSPGAGMGKVMVFPLPVPDWSGRVQGVKHVIRSWAWCTEHQLLILASLPQDREGDNSREMVGDLNSLSGFSGRFYATANGLCCYLNVQVLPSRKETSISRVVDLDDVRVERNLTRDLVFLALATVVHDLSLGIHLMAKWNTDLEGSGG